MVKVRINSAHNARKNLALPTLQCREKGEERGKHKKGALCINK